MSGKNIQSHYANIWPGSMKKPSKYPIQIRSYLLELSKMGYEPGNSTNPWLRSRQLTWMRSLPGPSATSREKKATKKKRLRDSTGNTRSREDAPSRRREYPRTTTRERHTPRPYRPSSYPDEYLTPLNKRREDILKEVAHMNLIREPHRPKVQMS